MRGTTKLLSLAVLPVAAAGIVASTAGMASAASHEASDVQVQKRWGLDGGQTINNQDMHCPDAQPYLIDERLTTGRIMPKGVRVIEHGPGVIGATAVAFNKDGYQAGISGLSMTNWGWGFNYSELVVTMYCTADTSHAARW